MAYDESCFGLAVISLILISFESRPLRRWGRGGVGKRLYASNLTARQKGMVYRGGCGLRSKAEIVNSYIRIKKGIFDYICESIYEKIISHEFYTEFLTVIPAAC